jgi:hypothetical protein
MVAHGIMVMYGIMPHGIAPKLNVGVVCDF